ncbi:hypothetical protein BSIN_2582 [Burkholderia singularis]|uniref:Uncharacterized protein n=1 Tax=Burkholderia singularis TaxID=1503053 RepID=A0A238H3F0_9BURK|nr:hypothetical protein BSIN_2582 [Burkholderia singularis]
MKAGVGMRTTVRPLQAGAAVLPKEFSRIFASRAMRIARRGAVCVPKTS